MDAAMITYYDDGKEVEKQLSIRYLSQPDACVDDAAPSTNLSPEFELRSMASHPCWSSNNSTPPWQSMSMPISI
jgi:hypothetical protein